jgi:hypothetical protein
MFGLIAFYFLNFNYLNIFNLVNLEKTEFLFTNSDWFQQLQVKAYTLHIISFCLDETNSIGLNLSFTAEQRQYFSALFSIFFNNAVTLSEFKLFFDEFEKFEKLFNNIFFDSTFFIKANQHFLNY